MIMNANIATTSNKLQRACQLVTELGDKEQELRRLHDLFAGYIGEAIKAHRESLGIGLRAAARQMECSATFLRHVELGSRLARLVWLERAARLRGETNFPNGATADARMST
jgi:hypothetical protein